MNIHYIQVLKLIFKNIFSYFIFSFTFTFLDFFILSHLFFLFVFSNECLFLLYKNVVFNKNHL